MKLSRLVATLSVLVLACSTANAANVEAYAHPTMLLLILIVSFLVSFYIHTTTTHFVKFNLAIKMKKLQEMFRNFKDF